MLRKNFTLDAHHFRNTVYNNNNVFSVMKTLEFIVNHLESVGTYEVIHSNVIDSKSTILKRE